MHAFYEIFWNLVAVALSPLHLRCFMTVQAGKCRVEGDYFDRILSPVPIDIRSFARLLWIPKSNNFQEWLLVIYTVLDVFHLGLKKIEVYAAYCCSAFGLFFNMLLKCRSQLLWFSALCLLQNCPLNVEYLMMDASILLPPTGTPLTGIDFCKRLPCGEVERARKVNLWVWVCGCVR